MAGARKVILIVIDGLTASTFEAAVDRTRTPALAFLAEEGTYRRAVSTFPSLTPVCLSSLATGAHPDVHEIPHLVWYHRGERRLVEYGSSFAALRAAGARRSIRDAIFNMNEQHLGRRAVTVFEALEDAGRTAAAVNITCYRGRTRHRPVVPGLSRPAFGPRRFFFYNLYESDATGAPVGVGGRAGGSLDRYAAAVGRWLVTRDGFDFFACYLPDYDFASHLTGPDGAADALARSDRAIGALIEAAGGADDFLDRYALIVCSDHGQTAIADVARLEGSFRDVPGVLVTASNRAGMIYRLPGCPLEAAELAGMLDGDAASEVALYLDGGEGVARREGAELRFEARPDGWRTTGDARVLDHPHGLERAWAALRNPNAGDVLVSAAPGFEFADLGGRHHAGGGSHGSLAPEDSLVPMLAVGIDALPSSITEVAPSVLRHFGVEPPTYAASLARAA